MVFEKKENPLSKISQFTDANIGLETLKSLQMFLTPILSTAKLLFICIQYIFLTAAHRKEPNILWITRYKMQYISQMFMNLMVNLDEFKTKLPTNLCNHIKTIQPNFKVPSSILIFLQQSMLTKMWTFLRVILSWEPSCICTPWLYGFHKKSGR